MKTGTDRKQNEKYRKGTSDFCIIYPVELLLALSLVMTLWTALPHY